MGRRKINFESTAEGQANLKNSFLASLKQNTAHLVPKMHVANDGPYTVKTMVNGQQVRTNYFDDLQDAKNYSAFVLTNYQAPSTDIHLKIANFSGETIEDFTPETDLTWFKLTADECERLLPARMINSDLHRGSYQDFNIKSAEYKPFTAKGY